MVEYHVEGLGFKASLAVDTADVCDRWVGRPDSGAVGYFTCQQCDYLELFSQIDKMLADRVEGLGSVFYSRSSYWSSILAAYCLKYWKAVDAYLV